MESILARLTKEDLFRKWKQENKKVKQLQTEVKGLKAKENRPSIPKAAIQPLVLNLMQGTEEISEQELSVRWFETFSVKYPMQEVSRIIERDEQDFIVEESKPGERCFRMKSVGDCKNAEEEQQTSLRVELEEQLSAAKHELELQKSKVEQLKREHERALSEQAKMVSDSEAQRLRLEMSLKELTNRFSEMKSSYKQKLERVELEQKQLEEASTKKDKVEFDSVLEEFITLRSDDSQSAKSANGKLSKSTMRLLAKVVKLEAPGALLPKLDDALECSQESKNTPEEEESKLRDPDIEKPLDGVKKDSSSTKRSSASSSESWSANKPDTAFSNRMRKIRTRKMQEKVIAAEGEQELRDQLEELQGLQMSQKKELEEMRTNQQAIENEREKLKHELQTLRQECNELKLELDALSDSQCVLEKERDGLRVAEESSKRDYEELRTEMDGLKQQLKDTTVKCNSMKKSLAAGEKSHKKDKKEHQEKLRSFKEKVQNQKAQLRRLEMSLKESRERNNSLESDLTKTEDRLSKAEAKVEKLREDEFKSIRNIGQTKNSLQRDLDIFKDKLQRVQKEKATFHKQLTGQREKCRTLQDSKKLLEQEVEKYRSMKDELELMKKGQKEKTERISLLQKMVEEAKQANHVINLESSLVSTFTDILGEDEKEKKDGDKQSKITNDIEQSKSSRVDDDADLKKLKSEDPLLKARLEKAESELVSLRKLQKKMNKAKKQIEDMRHAKESDQKRLDNIRNLKKSLEIEVKSMRQETVILKNKNSKLLSKVERYHSELEQEKSKAQGLNENLLRAKSALMSAVQARQEDRSDFNSQVERLKTERAKTQSDLEHQLSKVKMLKSNQQSSSFAERKIPQLEHEKANLRKKIAELQEVNKKLQDALRSSETMQRDGKNKNAEKIEAMEKQLLKVNLQLTESIEDNNRLKENAKESVEKFRNIMEEKAQAVVEKGELQVKFDQLSKNLIKGMKHMKQMKQEVSEKDKELMDAKSELEELSHQLQKNSKQKSETELLQNGEIEETRKKLLEKGKEFEALLRENRELSKNQLQTSEQLAHLKEKLRTAEEQIRDLNADIKQANAAKHSALEAEERSTLKLADLKAQVKISREMQDRVETDKLILEQELRKQHEIVIEVQQRLEDNDIKTKNLLNELNDLKTENQGLTCSYEEQLNELRRRNDELKRYNLNKRKASPKGRTQSSGFDDDFLMQIATKQALRESRIEMVTKKNKLLKTRAEKLQQALTASRREKRQLRNYIKQLQTPELMDFRYIKNIVVKFLTLSDSFTEEQLTLCSVLASCLNFSEVDKCLVDQVYFSRTMATLTNTRSTLFPKNSKPRLSNQSPVTSPVTHSGRS